MIRKFPSGKSSFLCSFFSSSFCSQHLMLSHGQDPFNDDFSVRYWCSLLLSYNYTFKPTIRPSYRPNDQPTDSIQMFAGQKHWLLSTQWFVSVATHIIPLKCRWFTFDSFSFGWSLFNRLNVANHSEWNVTFGKTEEKKRWALN